MRFAPSQHQSGLLSAFFGLHSIGLFSSAVAGLSAACAIVLPRLSVMRTDVVMAPRAFHPVSLSRLSLAPAAQPQPEPMLEGKSGLCRPRPLQGRIVGVQFAPDPLPPKVPGYLAGRAAPEEAI